MNFAAWFTADNIWLGVGFGGQALFASRFIIQWFKSEIVGRSVIPMAFWYCSLGGGIVLLSYAISHSRPRHHHRPDDGRHCLFAQSLSYLPRKTGREARGGRRRRDVLGEGRWCVGG